MKEEHKEKTTTKEGKGRKKEKPDIKLWVMAIALGLLMILSGVQAFELMRLKAKLNTELPAVIAAASKANTGSGAGGGGDINTLKKNLANLPGIVGGC